MVDQLEVQHNDFSTEKGVTTEYDSDGTIAYQSIDSRTGKAKGILGQDVEERNIREEFDGKGIKVHEEKDIIEPNTFGTDIVSHKEKDINPDTTRDIMPMGVTLDKNDDIYISFRSFDCRYYADESRLPPRDTLYHIAKLSGKTGEVINVKNIVFNNKIISMNIKTANDGNIYIYGDAASPNIYPTNKTYYIAKINNNLDIEWIEFPCPSCYPITDFIDLEPGHFALVGSADYLNIPKIMEYIDNNDISDDKKRINILQYPNPAMEQVAINGSFDYIGDVSISIIDLNGNVLKSLDTYSNEKEFNYTFTISELTAGTYFVLIRYDNQNIIDKLVISR